MCLVKLIVIHLILCNKLIITIEENRWEKSEKFKNADDDIRIRTKKINGDIDIDDDDGDGDVDFIDNNAIRPYNYYDIIKNHGNYNKASVDSETEKVEINENNGENNVNLENYFNNYSSNENTMCFLDELRLRLIWWAHPNGTLIQNILAWNELNYLDLSFRNENDEILLKHTIKEIFNNSIAVFSAAFNMLRAAPFKTLYLLRNSLKYLTLKGNNFSTLGLVDTNKNLQWATFPKLYQLKELDISYCQIEYLYSDSFKNLSNLQHLFLSNNKLLQIPSDGFYYLRKLKYLDLSHINAITFDMPILTPTLDTMINLVVGLKISQNTFKYLPDLEYLDLSHSKLTRNSAVAFSYLGSKLTYLSLCYTSFPLIGTGMFRNTRLKAIDLSGNSYAAYNIVDYSFQGVANTLKYVFFEKSNLKNLKWVKILNNLIVLDLSSNNINCLVNDTFKSLVNLQVLDLSDNHISNWYSRVFTNNQNLKLLNLRDNNINILTSEMLKDFQGLEYLGIGENNFVCDCVLRDFVDIAAANNKHIECDDDNVLNGNNELNIINNFYDTIHPIAINYNSTFINYTMHNNGYGETIPQSYTWNKYKKQIAKSYENIQKFKLLNQKFNYKLFSKYYASKVNPCTNTGNIFIYDKINGSTLNFQLLDYENDHYWCFNETEKFSFVDLNCKSRSFNDEFIKEINNLKTYVICGVLISFIFFGLITLIYLKRWRIRYYYITIKNAALLSAVERGGIERQIAINENTTYDIFISYCDSDREWVLQELLPNIENMDDMSICLHERDFQVGLTILENIITCMDRSRSLLLVISKSFLLSHWCQFEMHLAQHRMFETNKEHLILVILEDISKTKRPKTLQYLMEVKTYIKWPKNDDEKKVFWKRLRKSLGTIGWNSNN